jgi:hypothetical protein
LALERHTILQTLLRLTESSRYLEIGVDQGTTFRLLKADRKAAVDVRFAFDVKAEQRDNPNKSVDYYEMTSDHYFATACSGEQFDVIFIDGLHTFEQTLRDLMNATYALAPGGVIVIDDVMPSTYAASLPDLDLSRRFWQATGNPDGSWMGDVYKLVFFIRDLLPSYSYATVQEGHGQTILWAGPRVPTDSAPSMQRIATMQYVDAVMNRDGFNMKPFADILNDIAIAQKKRASAKPAAAAVQASEAVSTASKRR